MEKDDCKDKCKEVLGKGNKAYLLGLNRTQIKLIMHNDSSRKRFFRALDEHGMELVEFYKVIES